MVDKATRAVMLGRKVTGLHNVQGRWPDRLLELVHVANGWQGGRHEINKLHLNISFIGTIYRIDVIAA